MLHFHLPCWHIRLVFYKIVNAFSAAFICSSENTFYDLSDLRKIVVALLPKQSVMFEGHLILEILLIRVDRQLINMCFSSVCRVLNVLIWETK
jgi:hypothetical protein